MTMFVGDDVVLGMDEILGDDDDIFGGDDDELSGDDDILGAAIRKAKAAGKTSLATKLARARAAGGVIVQNKQPTDLRDQVLPFPTTSLAAGAAAIITTQPQRKFRAERLFVPSNQAINFLILDFSIAQEPQFVAPGAVSASLFTEVAVGSRLKGKTANLGALISLNVQNISGATNSINAAIIGTVVM